MRELDVRASGFPESHQSLRGQGLLGVLWIQQNPFPCEITGFLILEIMLAEMSLQESSSCKKVL